MYLHMALFKLAPWCGSRRELRTGVDSHRVDLLRRGMGWVWFLSISSPTPRTSDTEGGSAWGPQQPLPLI